MEFLSTESILRRLETLPPDDRDNYVFLTAMGVLGRPLVLREEEGDPFPPRFGGDADFAEFRAKLLRNPAPDSFIAKALLLEILQQAFNIGDYSKAGEVYRRGRDLKAFLEQKVASGTVDRETADRMVKRIVEDLPSIEKRLRAGHAKYRVFCDSVVRGVFEDAEREYDEHAKAFLESKSTFEQH
jgi:hypothetical protein